MIVLGYNSDRFVLTSESIEKDEYYPNTCKVFGRYCKIWKIIDDFHIMSLITNDPNDNIKIDLE